MESTPGVPSGAPTVNGECCHVYSFDPQTHAACIAYGDTKGKSCINRYDGKSKLRPWSYNCNQNCLRQGALQCYNVISNNSAHISLSLPYSRKSTANSYHNQLDELVGHCMVELWPPKALSKPFR